jgi:hypothetical protein
VSSVMADESAIAVKLGSMAIRWTSMSRHRHKQTTAEPTSNVDLSMLSNVVSAREPF